MGLLIVMVLKETGWPFRRLERKQLAKLELLLGLVHNGEWFSFWTHVCSYFQFSTALWGMLEVNFCTHVSWRLFYFADCNLQNTPLQYAVLNAHKPVNVTRFASKVSKTRSVSI
uniref:Uncharacterized protein n=1 Tax=Physcomitrium patens TaxID=3218 RepID=A0A2K1L7L8_PHYPA|nr:hypothetical protein PHYPA_000426 [Physcomitrium patens]